MDFEPQSEKEDLDLYIPLWIFVYYNIMNNATLWCFKQKKCQCQYFQKTKALLVDRSKGTYHIEKH